MTVAEKPRKNNVPELVDDQDLELENIVGNLMIAQYQVDKLRTRLSERVVGYGSTGNRKASSHVFKHNGKWYKLSLKIDEMPEAAQ